MARSSPTIIDAMSVAKLVRFLESLPRPVILFLFGALNALIGVVDYLTGTDATFSALYLFPICAAAWFVGIGAAYGFAVLSSVLWVSGDILAGAYYSSAWVPVWNLTSRFAIFIVFAHLIVALHNALSDLEARAAERAAKLTSEIEARERVERELLSISEREQQRLGHDIHDSLCQHLTGTALAGQVLVQNLKAQKSSQAESAAKIVELIEDGISLSRNLARGLNSVSLSSGGLMEALEDFALSTSALFNISCHFECPLPVLISDRETAEHLYRIAQEAVGNAIKHGHAKHIVIQLELSTAGKLLRVVDDGSGLSPANVNGKGMGLRIMNYRAGVIGAKFNIRKRDTRGTIVSCLLPMESETAP
jgi:signal transduction histidine kinase